MGSCILARIFQGEECLGLSWGSHAINNSVFCEFKQSSTTTLHK